MCSALVNPIVSILTLGFFLGLRHATDPDHVVAVSTFVARHRSIQQSMWVGLFWGLGHTLTVVLAGSIVVLAGVEVPAKLGLSLEFSVGLMLVFLGWINLRGVTGWLKGAAEGTPGGGHSHSHVHAHGDYVHTHPHRHDPEQHPHPPGKTPVAWMDRSLAGIPLYRLARPVLVGVVHGLAGSSAIALLVLAAIPQSGWAVAYLFLFGLGTIVGMMSVTAAIALPLALEGSRFVGMSRTFRFVSGAASLAFGLFIAFRMGSALLATLPVK